MTQEDFQTLDFANKLDEIYRILPKPTQPGESPIAGLFGSGRSEHTAPKFNPPEGSIDFENIFGSYPNTGFSPHK